MQLRRAPKYKFAVQARQIIQTAPRLFLGCYQGVSEKNSTMPGRKRANPQRVDADSPAKRRELFQFVPSARFLTTAVGLPACADSARLPHDFAATAVKPLTELSNTANDSGEVHNTSKFLCLKKKVAGYVFQKFWCPGVG